MTAQKKLNITYFLLIWNIMINHHYPNEVSKPLNPEIAKKIHLSCLEKIISH